jgi:RCC1 and BTB domain-containing protein
MSFLDAIKQRKQVNEQETPEEQCKGKKYPINVYSCGYGNYGRLAQGNTQSSARFINCYALAPIRVKKLATGAAHTLILNYEGALFTWGKCHYGQLGHGKLDADRCALFSLPRLNNSRWLPTRVETLKDVPIEQIAAGDSFSLVAGHGHVYSFGCGFYGLFF